MDGKGWVTTLDGETADSWEDGSTPKSTDVSSKIPKFDSQHPNGDSQPSITPVPEVLSDVLFWPLWINIYSAIHTYA